MLKVWRTSFSAGSLLMRNCHASYISAVILYVGNIHAYLKTIAMNLLYYVLDLSIQLKYTIVQTKTGNEIIIF